MKILKRAVAASPDKPSRPDKPVAENKAPAISGEILDVVKAREKRSAGVIRVSSSTALDYGRVRTGILALDLCLGGGIKLSRGTMFYGEKSAGKSTLSLILIRQVQAAFPDKVAVYLDVEGSFDKAWATKLGVDLDRMIIVEPESGEDAVDLADALTRSNETSIIVTDSIAFLTPMKELEQSAEDSLMAVHARLIGNFLRRLNNAMLVERHRGHLPIILHLNQFRMRIVQFGDPRCCGANTLVCFADGRSIRMRKVVDERIEGEVWAYNEEADTFQPARIIDWQHNGNVKENEFISVISKGVGSRNGRFGFTVTYDHPVLTDKGWKPAADLVVGDNLISKKIDRMNGTFKDFVYGMMCGDTSLAPLNGLTGMTATMRLEDRHNPEYLAWKVAKLAPFIQLRLRRVKGKLATVRRQFVSKASCELRDLYNTFNGVRDPMVFMSSFSWLGMAVWVMDDGYLDDHGRIVLAVGRLTADELTNLSVMLDGTNGLHNTPKQDKQLVFSAYGTKALCEGIKTYIPECMQRKLPVEYRGYYVDFDLQSDATYISEYSEIIKAGTASKSQMRQKGKYDITVEGYHNYLVGGSTNGVVVHNTLPGGKALEFSTSQQVLISNKENKGKDEFGNEVVLFNEHSFQVTKNKTGGPMKEGKFKLVRYPSEGLPEGYVDQTRTILSFAAQAGLYEGSGRRHDLKEFGVFSSFEEVSNYFYENPEVPDVLSGRIIDFFVSKWGMD